MLCTCFIYIIDTIPLLPTSLPSTPHNILMCYTTYHRHTRYTAYLLTCHPHTAELTSHTSPPTPSHAHTYTKAAQVDMIDYADNTNTPDPTSSSLHTTPHGPHIHSIHITHNIYKAQQPLSVHTQCLHTSHTPFGPASNMVCPPFRGPPSTLFLASTSLPVAASSLSLNQHPGAQQLDPTVKPSTGIPG